MKFWFDTDSTEWGENLYHDSVSVIVPRFTSFVEDFVLCCYQVTIPFLLAEQISFGFCGSEHEHYASFFCVSTFEASPSESEFSLSEERASTCVSKSSGLSVKDCNQTGMPCVGSSLFVSSAGSRFTVARLSGFCQHRFTTCMLVTSSCHWN